MKLGDVSVEIGVGREVVLLDFLLIVKAAPYQCVIRTSQP